MELMLYLLIGVKVEDGILFEVWYVMVIGYVYVVLNLDCLVDLFLFDWLYLEIVVDILVVLVYIVGFSGDDVIDFCKVFEWIDLFVFGGMLLLLYYCVVFVDMVCIVMVVLLIGIVFLLMLVVFVW